MKKITARLSAWLGRVRASASVPRSSASKKADRAPWTGRLLSTAFDLGFYSMAFYFLTALLGVETFAHAAPVLLITFPVYYMVVEWLLGRSLGKIFLGYKMILPETVNPKTFMAVRGMIRFVPLVNFAMLLSWRRITLLDLFSYTGVYSSTPSSSRKGKKSRRRTRESPAKDPVGDSGEESNKSSAARTIKSPKGFDPLGLER